MSEHTAEKDAPIDWSRMNHGICPKCGEDKFIGHGPLCVDCLIPPADDQEATDE